ncbi:hypothetical protein [Salipiger mucosus]|uniref:Uncharacterized protein n=1 Tax=Salipiger mucosus DSM 16094 TaxID=1123237 RepID=S9QR28_9RHOB|nr:hypothetical protein [Salipiger mucosus]EPX82073.1 hypothetical protein Salmuc_02440 [Salipiger mucosus DSM 16094]
MSPVLTLPTLRDRGYPSPAQFGETLTDWREELALQLETLGVPERIAQLRETCLATGGIWIDPPDGFRGYCEITVGGICVTGEDMAECAAAWIKAVLRVSRAAAEAEGAA